MKTIELTVEGMTCGHCERSVEEALKEIGAQGKANSKTGLTQITFDENTTDLEKIRHAIDESGYTVKK